MSTNAREALRHLTGALENHLEAVLERRSAEDAAVDDAFDAVAEAFERYEDVLDSTLGESLPLVLDEDVSDTYDDGDDDDELDDDDDELDDDGPEPVGIDGHAVENDDEMDDDIEEFDLR